MSDIHSNLEALKAVLRQAVKGEGFDQVWSIGDIVGYGPNPVECIDQLAQYKPVAIAGNHDLAACGKIEMDDFNEHAHKAIRATILQITLEHYNYFLDLPTKLVIDGFTLVHGSAKAPYWLEYVTSPEIALESLQIIDTDKCLVGHSHRSFVCRLKGDNAELEDFPPDQPVQLGDDKLIINPGSVGQPRDRDPRASYAIYDSSDDTMTHHRAEYDVAETQRKMLEQGSDDYLIHRLAYGL